MPSSRASRRAISKASSLVTWTTSSMISVFSTSGTKPAPMPWILCGPGSTARTARRTARRLDGDRLEARLARLDHLADAGDGAAGADAGHQDVHLAVGVAPDLLGGGAAVDLRVGRVLELLRHEGVRDVPGPAPRPCRWRRASPRRRGSAPARRRRPCSSRRRSRLMRLRHRRRSAGSPWRRAAKARRDAGVAAGRLDDHGVLARSCRPARPPRSWPRRCGP